MDYTTRLERDKPGVTGIPGIDSQHTELVFMLDAFLGSLKKDDLTLDFIYATLEGIMSSLKCHFLTEEGLMEIIDFPKIADHKAQHKEYICLFARELKALNNKHVEKVKIIQFVQAFRDTVIFHFTVSDGDYIGYIEKLITMREKFDISVLRARAIA